MQWFAAPHVRLTRHVLLNEFFMPGQRFVGLCAEGACYISKVCHENNARRLGGQWWAKTSPWHANDVGSV